MSLSRAFVTNALVFNNTNIGILSGTIDPSVVGVNATLGSLYIRSSDIFVKTGPLDTNWTKHNLSQDAEYLLRNGSISMTGNLNLGGNSITNVSLINGVNVSLHGSRHLPSGSDPLLTGTAVGLSNVTTNTVGTANSFARSDHTHAITGFQIESAALTAFATLSGTGIIVKTGTNTYTTRNIVGVAGRTTVTNNSGITADPTIDLANIGTAGTFGSSTNVPVITLDNYGRTTGVASTPISFPVTSVAGKTGAVTLILSDISNVVLSSPSVGQVLSFNGTNWINSNASSGTVTSVGLTPPVAGISVSGSPITTSGNISLSLANDLLAVESLSTTGLAVRTGVDTWTTRSVVGGTGVSVTNGDGISGNPTVTNTGVLSLTGTANRVSVSGSTGNITISAPQDIATTSTPTFQQITLGADPINPLHAATKQYVDNSITGLDVKQSVRVATTTNITLSGTQTIDGVSVIAGDRVLVKNQTTANQNGIYVANAGTWSRSTDADNTGSPNEVTAGMYTFVEEGASNGDSGWILTTDNPITLGTTNLTFAQFTGTGQITAGNGLTKTGNTLNVTPASAMRLVVSPGSIDLALSGITAGTYRSVTIDAYGRATAGTNPTTLVGYGITDAQPLNANLTAISGVSVTGFYSRTGSTTAEARTIQGTAGRVSVTNGDGISGNPVIDLSTTGTAGTYGLVTTDAYGRVTSGAVVLPIANGGTGLSTLNGANRVLGINSTNTGLEYKQIVAGTNISVTHAAESITISSTGGGGTPAAPVNSVQFNNAGTFGGSSAMIWDTTNQRLVVNNGIATTPDVCVGGTTSPGTSTLYVEVNTSSSNVEGCRIYFNRLTPGISGYITNEYDGATPNIRIIDEDDDPPYISFATIGTGSFAAPQYVNRFGSRGPVAGATTGFSWKLGTTEIASMDSNFYLPPSGTTAQRPSTPVAGMMRYNTTLRSTEEYVPNVWVRRVGLLDKTTTNVSTSSTSDFNLISYTIPGGTLGTDGLIRIRAQGTWQNTSGSNRNVTISISYGGVTMYSDTATNLSNGNEVGWNMDIVLSSNGNASSQYVNGVVQIGGTGGVSVGITGDLATDEINSNAVLTGTSAINSANDQVLNIAVRHSGTGAVFTKIFHTIERL